MLSRIEKLVEKFLRRPPEASFQEVEYVLRAFGYSRWRRSKHGVIFLKHRERPINIPLKSPGRTKVNRVYINMIIDQLNLEEWYEQRQRP